MRPLAALEDVAATVATQARADPDLKARLECGVGGHGDALCAALPVLVEPLGSGAAGPLGQEAHAGERTIGALAALLGALGASSRPALVLLDGCQWADELTLRLLVRFEEGAGDGDRHALLVAAQRSEEAGGLGLTAGLLASRRLPLGQLERDDLRALAESMAGPLPAAAIDAVARLSEGNPFLAAAALEGIIEAGVLAAEPEGGWRLDPTALAEVQASHGAARLLAHRIDGLSPATLRVLSIGALLGREFDLPLLAALAGVAEADVVAAIDDARRRRMVFAGGPGTRAALVHDRLRDALLDRLPAEARRELHGRAAELLEGGDGERVFEIAGHLDAAGAPERALPHALAAAERARARSGSSAAASPAAGCASSPPSPWRSPRGRSTRSSRPSSPPGAGSKARSPSFSPFACRLASRSSRITVRGGFPRSGSRSAR